MTKRTKVTPGPQVTVRLSGGARIVIVPGGVPGNRFAFFGIAKGDDALGSVFLSAKEVERLGSAVQRVVVHMRRAAAEDEKGAKP